MKTPQLTRIPLAKLKSAKHNPPSRLEARRLEELKESISEIGLIQPLIVTKSNTVVEGHRRLAAVKALGWTEVPCFMIADEYADRVYADLNATAKKMSGSELLHVYLANPQAVTSKVRRQISRVEAVVGRVLLKRMAENSGVTCFMAAKMIAKYVGRDDEGFLVQAVEWIMDHRTLYTARIYIKTGQPPKRLYASVLNNRGLTVNAKPSAK